MFWWFAGTLPAGTGIVNLSVVQEELNYSERGNVSKTVKSLVDKGFLERERMGRSFSYTLNKNWFGYH